MRFGSVCSGIEAASVAWYPLGWHAAWLSEIDPAASAVLAHRFPHVPNLGDMIEIAPMIAAGIVEAPDLLVGGTPCQGFSVAGMRGGLSDPRGQLTLVYVETLDAIDDARRAADEPECIAVWENVPGVLSMGDNAFGNFLAALVGEDEALEPGPRPEPGRSSTHWSWDKKAGEHRTKWPDAGLVVGPKRAIAWRVLDAQFFGLAQRRKRVFVVASARDGFDPGEILFEFDGVRRDSPPSRQKGQDPADAPVPCLTSSGRGVRTIGETRGQDPVVAVRLTNRVSQSPIGARMLGFGHYEIDETASTMKARDYKDATDLVIEPVECVTGEIAHTLTAEGFDASEEGTGRGNPIVPHCFDARQKDIVQYGNMAGPLDTNGYSQAIAFTAKDHGQDATEDLSPTLRAGGHGDSHANGGVMPAVAYEVIPIDMRQASRGATMTNNRAEGSSGGAPGTGIGTDGDPSPTVSTSHAPAVAYSIRTAQTGANGIGIDEHLSPTLDVSGAPSVAYAFQPRIARNGRGDMGDVINALTAEAGTTGKGDAAPCVAYAIQERAICENPDAGPDGIGVRSDDRAYTLEARSVPQAVAFDTTQITHPENRSNPQPGDPCHPLAAEGKAPTICAPAMAVRRLMPVECERLQGFPDNWTRIPVAFHADRKVTKLRPEDMWELGIGPNGKAGWWLMAADGPRYKQCGNSMARNCMAWIGGRIKGWLELEPFRELIG